MSDMYLYLAFGLAWAAGVLIGMLVAGAVLLEHRFFWIILVRLPGGLYNELRTSARANRWSLATEVLDRLRQSFPEEQP